MKKEFTAINSDIFGFYEKSNFDVVLALNVMHSSLKEKQSYLKMKNYLNRLETKIMFFEHESSEEFKSFMWYKNLDEFEFIQFICENTNLSKWELIGKSKLGNNLYKIY